MNKGFTLVEILIAVLIMGILVTMAVPQYEKAIEKSRLAEVRTMLKRMYDAKQRVLDNMEQSTYTTSLFGFENLDFAIACTTSTSENGHQVTCGTDEFVYVINPPNNMDAVCAVRRRGDYQGVNFIYLGEQTNHPFKCNDGTLHSGSCDVYGLATWGANIPYCTLPS